MNIRLHGYSFDKKNFVLFSTSTYRLHSYLTNNKINILKLFFFFCIIVLFDHKVIPNYCFFMKKWLNYFFFKYFVYFKFAFMACLFWIFKITWFQISFYMVFYQFFLKNPNYIIISFIFIGFNDTSNYF